MFYILCKLYVTLCLIGNVLLSGDFYYGKYVKYKNGPLSSDTVIL